MADSTVAPEAVVEAAPVAPVAEAVAEPVVEAPVVERNAIAFVPVTLEDRVPVGSTFTRTPAGWSCKIMYGGSLRLSGDGQTMDHALADAGV